MSTQLVRDHSLDEKESHAWAEQQTNPEADQTAVMAALASKYVPGSDAEKALVRKLDMRIIVSQSLCAHFRFTTGEVAIRL